MALLEKVMGMSKLPKLHYHENEFSMRHVITRAFMNC